MNQSYRYTAKAQWTAGRRGRVQAEGLGDIEFSAPPEFKGEPGLWTPEHLFLASIVSCYVTTFRAIAEHSHFDFQALTLEVEGTIEKKEGGFQFTSVLLRPVLTVPSDEHRDRGLLLLSKAERSCIISRSVQGPVVLVPTIAAANPRLALEAAQHLALHP